MLKFGIVGAGAIAYVHAQALLELQNEVEIVAVCDNLKDKSEALIQSFNLKAQSFDNLDTMLERVKLDCLCVCLPPALHCDYSCKALERGIHVITEKPMAMSVEQCNLMIETAKKHNCQLGVICQNRYKTAHMRLKAMVEREALGKVHQVTVNSLWWRGENYYDIWWRGTWEVEGGGCLLSHGVHHLDLLLWLFGRPKSILASISNLAHSNSQCEDFVSAILRFDNGMQANVTVSLVNHGEEQEIILQGERGKLAIPFKIASNRALENGFPEDNPESVAKLQSLYESLAECQYEGHKAQLLHFIKAVLGQETLETSGECGRDVIEVIMAIYKSSVLKEEVQLPIKADDPFYKHESRIKLMPHFHEKTKSIQDFKTQKITLGRDVGK